MGIQQATKNNTITLRQYRINKDKAIKKLALDFLNPAENFAGIVECLGDIRHIEKKGEMRQDLDVIDCRIITALETREEEEENQDGDTITRKVQRKYNNEEYSLVLSKTVLLNKFRELQENHKSLRGKRIVIIGLGRAEDKNYYDYYVATEEEAIREGVIEPL